MDYVECIEEGINNNICAICFEEIDPNKPDLIWTCNQCNKDLHKDCLNNWQGNCPYCRNEIHYPIRTSGPPNNSPNITIVNPTPRIRIAHYHYQYCGNVIGCCFFVVIICACVFCFSVIFNWDLFEHINYNRTLPFNHKKNNHLY